MTKFKNYDLLMESLEECAKFIYFSAYVSLIASIRDKIINKNLTFEQALYKSSPSCVRRCVHNAVSKTYHKKIRNLNNEKFNMKKGINKNE